MAGYQFIREECYAKTRGQGAPTGIKGKARDASSGKISGRELVAEAIREPGASPHVPHPSPPRCLYGQEAADLMLWYEQIEACADDIRVKTKAGVEKRQRSDVPIVMGVVASFPGKADESDQQYVLWRAETVRFMRERYGNRLASVLEHTDEEHGHIHALVADAGRPVKPLAAGYSQMQKAAVEGLPKKEQSLAYQAGGRALQDDFFDKVAVRVGLARIGPRKPRLTRRQWKARQQENEAIAAALAKAAAAAERIEAGKRMLREDAKKLDVQARDTNAKAARVAAAEAAVRVEIGKIREQDIALKKAQTEAKAERDLRRAAETKLARVSVENKALGDDLNVAQNELSSLKRRYKSAPE